MRWVSPRHFWHGSPLRAALIFMVLSGTWIVTSDSIVEAVVADRVAAAMVSTLKGLIYVALASSVVFWLVRASVRATEASAEAVHASERQFRDLLERVDLLAVVFDAAGSIRFCNEAVVRATGWSKIEVIGRNFFELFLVVPSAREDWRLRAGAGGSGWSGPAHAEQAITTRDGDQRTIRWTTTVLRDSGGAVSGGAAVGEDVTDRQRIELELRQAQKMEALGRLAGSTAHDFNNVLTAIRGYADLALLDLKPDEPLAADLSEIRRAADRASALTAQLLAFSRRGPAAPAGPVDVSEVVGEVEPMLRRLVGERIVLTVRSVAGCWVEADSGQLEQAILNLAVNARDAMPSGGSLAIAVEPADDQLVRERAMLGGRLGPHVLVDVRDTGSGIPPEVLGHVFEPFYTTKARGKGTGLGLATVYSAVAAAGGQIWVESEPGRGTAVRILLPESEARPSEGPAVAPATTPAHGTERVLVVEDDAAVRSLVRTVLQREGYTVLEAHDGEEAVRVFTAQPVDLLVSDLAMPGIGGRELVSRLHGRWPDLPVLLISGYDAEAAEEVGPVDAQGSKDRDGRGSRLLAKPFSAAELVVAVRSLLDAPL